MKQMNESCYICEVCGLTYSGNKKLCECGNGCKVHEDCDIAVIEYSLKNKMEGQR